MQFNHSSVELLEALWKVRMIPCKSASGEWTRWKATRCLIADRGLS